MRLRLLGLILVLGCSGKSEDNPSPGGAVAHYAVSASGPIAWDAVPFPNDLHLGADGTIDLATLPRGLEAETVWSATLGLFDKRKGFCTTCAVHFPIDGSLASPPSSIDAPKADDPVLFVDLEAKTLLPLRTQWSEDEHRFSVRMSPGIVLMRKHRYGVALTNAILAKDGRPLRADAAFQAARDGGGEPRLRTLVGPALDTLGTMGVSRERIVAFTTFTTDDVLADGLAAREIVTKATRPSFVLEKTFVGAAVDDLFGTPTEKLVGADRPASDGHLGVLHDSIATVILGKIRAPRVIEGKGTQIGAPLRDANGALVAGELQDVPMVVIVPKGIDLAKAPVVFFHTGLTGTLSNALVLAETIARAGAVLVSIEPALHGSRAATGKDDRNVSRDIPGADGFYEHDGNEVGASFVGTVGAATGKKGFPGYVLGIGLQHLSDALMGLRFIREGDLATIRAADSSVSTLAFDTSRIGYVGLSNGSVIGTKVAALDRGLSAVVLNVPVGSLSESAFMGPGFKSLIGLLVRPSLQIPELDEVTASLRFDPVFDMYRWAIDPIDPLAFAPYLVRAPLEASNGDLLIQHAGHDELVTPIYADALASAVGVPGVGEYHGAPVEPTKLPIELDVGGKITAASVRFPGAAHVMIAYPRTDSDWEPPLEPPYKKRAATVKLDNPVVDVQRQIERFFATRFTKGRARIE